MWGRKVKMEGAPVRMASAYACYRQESAEAIHPKPCNRVRVTTDDGQQELLYCQGIKLVANPRGKRDTRPKRHVVVVTNVVAKNPTGSKCWCSVWGGGQGGKHHRHRHPHRLVEPGLAGRGRGARRGREDVVLASHSRAPPLFSPRQSEGPKWALGGPSGGAGTGRFGWC